MPPIREAASKEDMLERLERYHLLVDAVRDYAIFMLDTDGYIISWNKGAEQLKGYKPDEIIGQHFSVFYSQKDKDARKPEIELEVSMANGRVEDEGWRIRKDGTSFWANVVITALFDKTGQHKGFAKVTRDLTERKQFEDNLIITKNKLEENYIELKALNATKDEFVSLASHQLRTPATGVKQYLSLLLDGYMGKLTEQQYDCVKKAYESNDRQIEIVNDLLRVAQLDAGKVLLLKQDADISEMLADIIDEQIDSFKKRKQTISHKFPDHRIIASVDVERLRMVLENIVDNASKYTREKGEISIHIKEEGDFVQVIIKDNGVGIAKKDLPKLFEKFSRISNELSQEVSGSGLGLYWADKIVRLHGGKIDVSSRKNAGTTFTVCVPKAHNA